MGEISDYMVDQMIWQELPPTAYDENNMYEDTIIQALACMSAWKENRNTLFWTTREGVKINYSGLTDDHLRNCYNTVVQNNGKDSARLLFNEMIYRKLLLMIQS